MLKRDQGISLFSDVRIIAETRLIEQVGGIIPQGLQALLASSHALDLAGQMLLAWNLNNKLNRLGNLVRIWGGSLTAPLLRQLLCPEAPAVADQDRKAW